ncbi:MAG: S41 family peptidase, partial [Limisphaerales bacterium]
MRRILALGTITALIHINAVAVDFTKDESETIARAVAGILDMHHFTHKRLDDDISKKHLGFMIDRLDYFHMFFLQSDVDEFRENFDVRLDNMVRRGMVSPANRIFERYLQRLNEATNHIENLLKSDFDFTVKERFQPDRHKLGWPKNEKERNELWRKRVKWEMLSGVLAGDEQEEIKERIWKRYSRMSRDYGKFDSSEILQLYLAALGRAFDPHSTYMAPITAQNFDIHNVSMQLTGIGAVLTEEDGYTKIVSVSPGGPADRSKEIFPDDRIVRVGQGEKKPVDVRDMRLNDVVSMIRGPKDSLVVLTIIPADATDDAERKVVKLVRDVIKIEAQLARGYLLEVPNKGSESRKYGVVELPTFYDRCSEDIAGLMDRLKEAGAEGMILDLRRNGGGLLAEAIALAGLFIKDGPVVQVKNFEREVMELNDEDS